MVKFLSGKSFDGDKVPVCAYWSTTKETDIDQSFTPLIDQETAGRCIANHYTFLEEISCFSAGRCNGEGKCLPCTQYRYGEGVRMGISHSPPLELLRQYQRGWSDEDLRSPFARIGGLVVRAPQQDQLPFHILLRNIQAEVAKCCRWSEADGVPTQFLITTIIDGPDEIELTASDGEKINLKGIRVKHNAFPEDTGTDTNPEGGSFFAVGSVVVAGWSDAPSFYLEPRTGLVKAGEGVVFKSQEDTTTVNSQAKVIANGVPSTLTVAQNAINYCGFQGQQNANAEADYYNNVRESSMPDEQKMEAYNRTVAAGESVNLIAEAKAAAVTLSQEAFVAAQEIVTATTSEAVSSASAECADALDGVAEQVDIANVNCGGQPASDTAAAASRQLRASSQSLRFAGRGGSTKCNLAFTDENPAAIWNSPDDGSLPCNGMRSDCKYYTGPKWEYATSQKLEVGQKVTAEAIQEIRFYSDDWARYSDPEEIFKSRFSTPFIWALKDFEAAGDVPKIEDMILYRPKVLFARKPPENEDAPPDSTDTIEDAWETMRVERVGISNFEELAFDKSVSRIQPGSERLDVESVPDYASKIGKFVVPTATRLRILHPPPIDDADAPFVYRAWTPKFTNRISLFGSSTADQTVYIVNNTALQNRDRYNEFYESTNIYDISTGLPGTNSEFSGQTSAEFFQIFANLEAEKATNQSSSVLGYDAATSSRTGFWSSINQVDLVHNEINEIFVFILIDPVTFIFDRVKVDCRVLHSIVGQDSFDGVDFTINDKGGDSKLGIASGNLVKSARLSATYHQVLGSEPVSLDYGYYAWRYKDRGLRFSSMNAGSDMDTGESVSGDDFSYVTETDASAFITNVSYRVVQYRLEETIANWYLINDCGIIMAEIASTNANRVMPLPNQRGEYKALAPVLVNNGATGSVVAQWAPEKVTLTIEGEEKDMVLIYRDEEGLGLPANYAIYGPAPGDANLFGRPDPTKDTLNIQFTYLRSQTHRREGGSTTAPEGEGELVSNNFYGDRLRTYNQNIDFSNTGLVAGGDDEDAIVFDQQDYVFVFKDSEDRPIGKKFVRFLVSYYNLACISVEIFYAWESTCTTYGLVPDLFLATGGSNGRKSSKMYATINESELTLGQRTRGVVGNKQKCSYIPNCGDHDILRLGRIRKEFETVINIATGEDQPIQQKAVYPSAGQAPGSFYSTSDIAYTHPPFSIWQLKRGSMWYPYDICELPRYNKTMMGKGKTDTTELINASTSAAGVQSGSFGEGTFNPGPGVQGALATRESEAYHTYDDVSARILDIHPTLRACLSGYTYGNTVAGASNFTGYARKRGEVDEFWFKVLEWIQPPFGNFGRAILMVEVSHTIGDYSPKPESIAWRWMPMYPIRDDMGATVDSFGEDLEPANYRLVATTCPYGGLGETVPTADSPRYTHKSLITNRPAGGIEYPYVPYYPSFLPDALRGKEPENQGVDAGSPVPKGSITTAWAWREQDKQIKRGQRGTAPMSGMRYLLPDYVLDNRRMEVRLRPPEGEYQVTYTAPSYTLDGEVSENAMMQLGVGPPREITIDFVNRIFGPALMPDTVYDTSAVLGDDPFPCTTRPSSNLQLGNPCGCEGNAGAATGNELPALFFHGDSIAPGDYVALYTTDEMGPAFPTDIDRDQITDPCCMCNYFLEQIHFRLSSTFLPVTPNIDPANTTFTKMTHTWSRVPHGIGSNKGRDGIWSGQENLAQNLIAIDQNKTGVMQVRPRTGAVRLDRALISAYFPSPKEAGAVLAEDSIGIIVPGPLPAGDPKLLGGIPVTEDHESRGESEQITLDLQFDTYISIKKVTIYFLAGKGLQVPKVYLTGILPQNRTGDYYTTRNGSLLGNSEVTANDTSLPGVNLNGVPYNSDDIQAGEALVGATIVPNTTDVVFWDKFYQEFHLIFPRRDNTLSMGIHSIEISADVLTSDSSLVETIFIPERRYYISEFSPAGKNPEEHLSGMDSCTAYWRTSSSNPTGGGNRFRSYAFGKKEPTENTNSQGGGQPTIGGSAKDLEKLQEKEYDTARKLMSSPYTYKYKSFTPLDEASWTTFIGGRGASWATTLRTRVRDLASIASHTSDTPLYGPIPDRSTWSAPGHAWIHNLDPNFAACCDGCGHSMLVEYKYLHLHDNLAPVESTGFWDDFSSGQGGASSVLPSAQTNPDIRVMREGELRDQNGKGISADILNASGMRRDKNGNLILTGYTADTIIG